MAKMIKIVIDESDASFSVDLTGFHGQGCDDIVKLFAEIGETTKVISKPEYRETNLTSVKVGR
jgi:hypothetical protein